MESFSAAFEWLADNWEDFWPVAFAGISAFVTVFAYFKTRKNAEQAERQADAATKQANAAKDQAEAAKRQADAAEIHNELMQRQINVSDGSIRPVRQEGPNSGEPSPKVAPLVIRWIEHDLYEAINGGDHEIYDVTIWDPTPEISDLHWDYLRPGESTQFQCFPDDDSRTIKMSWKTAPYSENSYNWDVPVPLKGR